MVVWVTEIPRSAIMITRSRKLSLKLVYQLTHRTMICRSKCRPLNRSLIRTNRCIPSPSSATPAFCTRAIRQREIRGVAVGRNNWTFFGSDQGGQTAAVLRSFVASCQRAGVDPFTWLKDVLSRIADHPITRLAELLPHNWAPVQG